MNIINVTEQMLPDLERLFKKLYNTDLITVLEDCDAILAGGALTSLATNKEVNDWDLYFKNKEGFVRFIKEIYNHWEPEVEGDYLLSGYDVVASLLTERSLLCKDRKDNLIQVIGYRLFPSVEDVFNAFDFTVNMCAYDFKERQVYAHPDFLKHCSQRYLKFNPGTHYPLMSGLRVHKYLDKGYSVSKSEMIRIFFTIANKEYNSWADVKGELSGMYGIPVDKLFDESVPFSLDAVVSQLSSVRVEDSPFETSQPEYYEVVKTFSQYFSEEDAEKASKTTSTLDWIF